MNGRRLKAVLRRRLVPAWLVACFHSCTPVKSSPTLRSVTASTTGPARAASALAWVKADLHLHTAEDPFDEIDYTAAELLERAHAAGFGILAITLHDKVFDDPAVFAQARELGILLIQAAELRIEGADTVLLNISVEEAAGIRTFDDLRRLRARRGKSLFVFAPHPFYRFGGSIGRRLEKEIDCFDAVEYCHFHVPLLNPNVPAVRFAARANKPLLATSDAHQLKFFGEHYSRLGLRVASGPPTLEAVFEAIRAHRIERVSPTGGLPRFLALMAFIFLIHPILTRLPGSKLMRARRPGTSEDGGKSAVDHPATA